MSKLEVESAYGTLQGERNGDCYVWKGIPYAKPPVGEYRYRPPLRPDGWSGIRQATRFGSAAVQPYARDQTSEDCLYLNVWSPGADGERRPVMVWFHGGGFTVGSGSDPVFDGTSFASRGDVVVVTVNYRLGIMGFLYLDEAGGDAYAASGNYGILDQIAALEWVRDNIEAFGGDPGRITIFGESAGARSVGLLLSLPQAEGLFHQAIIQSGMITTYRSRQDAVRITDDVLRKLGIGKQEVSKLRERPAAELLEAAPPFGPHVGLEPTIDGVFLPDLPLARIAEGCARHIPIMIGTNRHEIMPGFDPRWRGKTDEELMDIFAERVGPSFERASSFYLDKYAGEPSLQHKLAHLLTYRDFVVPAVQLAQVQDRYHAKAWVYRFDYESNGFATHGLELPFVFRNLRAPSAERITGDIASKELLADKMHQAWIAFARTGNPNWPSFTAEKRETMIFNVESGVEQDPLSDERQLWETCK